MAPSISGQPQQQSPNPLEPTPEMKGKEKLQTSNEGGNTFFPVQSTKEKGQQQHQQATTSQTMYVNAKTSILLQTAKVKTYKPGIAERGVDARLILDSGSQRSYVTTKLMNQLNLKVEGTENLSIKTFGGEEEQVQTCEFVRLHIKTGSSYQDLLITAFVVPTICQPLSHQTTKAAQEIYHHLEGIYLADKITSNEELEVDILVGSDQYWNLVTGAVRRGKAGPTAMETKIGWVLSGPVTGSETDKTSIVNLVNTHVLKCATQPLNTDSPEITRELRRFWELESLGVFPNEESVYERFTQSIKQKNKRYEVELPWKESHPVLPDNYRLSERRLKHLLMRLRSDPDILREYDTVIKEQLKKGIVEMVDQHNPGEIGKGTIFPTVQ